MDQWSGQLTDGRGLQEELAAAPVSVPNPWLLVAQSAFVLLTNFHIDSIITFWRRDDRRQ